MRLLSGARSDTGILPGSGGGVLMHVNRAGRLARGRRIGLMHRNMGHPKVVVADRCEARNGDVFTIASYCADTLPGPRPVTH
jgi:hypothetical protein